MVLKRENILGLIGKGRYHSALLTTFSFDFYFFEMKAMRWLRSCGIRNVNVLIDAHYYSKIMERLGGDEMTLAPAYSIYPIMGKSIFHPKIWMLFGEDEGLLIIGSGNLTNAGNGNNDEIWGAFHFSLKNTTNKPLFGAAWEYLQQICNSTKGHFFEKSTNWILSHSKWLQELPGNTIAKFHPIENNERVAFLCNSSREDTIWTQLLSLIGNERVTEITGLSPYYDKKGRTLQELRRAFPIAKIHIVLDESGSIPDKLENPKDFKFYDWYDLGINKNFHYKILNAGVPSKLHAKILHFKTKSGKEYCLFGSANLTPEGLGISGAIANNEVSMLLESRNRDLLKQMGVKLNKAYELSEYRQQKEESIYDTILKPNKKKLQLLAAELMYDELCLYAEGNCSVEALVRLFDFDHNLLTTLKLGQFSNEMRVPFPEGIPCPQFVQLYEAHSDKPISNKVLLSNISLLYKTHPNPKTELIERIVSEIEGGDFKKIIELLQYAVSDEAEENELNLTFNNRQVELEDGTDKQGNLYDLSGYTANSNSVFEKSLLASSVPLRVLDVLNFFHSKEFIDNHTTELREDEQEEDIGSIAGEEEIALPPERNLSLKALRSERNKLLGYFNKVADELYEYLYDNATLKGNKPSLNDLSKFLIAIELLFEFGGRNERYIEDFTENQFPFLPMEGDDLQDTKNVKGCVLTLIGQFLLFAKSGFKEYEFPYVQNKMEELKEQALVSSIVCILNVNWKEAEMHYAKCLLLNTVHYLSNRESEKFNNYWSQRMEQIGVKSQSLKSKVFKFDENFIWFQQSIIPLFSDTISKLAKKEFATQAYKASIIYKSHLGYCFVKDVSRQNEFTLSRPGFLWNDGFEDFVFHNNNDEYKPIYINQFILVEE